MAESVVDTYVLEYTAKTDKLEARLKELERQNNKLLLSTGKAGASLTEFAKGASGELGKVVPGLSAVTSGLGMIASGAGVAAIAVGAIGVAIKSATDLSKRFREQELTGRKLGITGTELEGYERNIRRVSGGLVSREETREQFAALRARQQEAFIDPVSKASREFSAMGINPKTTNKMPFDKLADEWAKSFSKMAKSQGVEKAVGYGQAIGQSQEYTMALIRQGDALSRNSKLSDEEVLQRAQAESEAKKLANAQKRLSIEMESTWTAIGILALPMLEKLVTSLSDVASDSDKAAIAIGGITAAFGIFAASPIIKLLTGIVKPAAGAAGTVAAGAGSAAGTGSSVAASSLLTKFSLIAAGAETYKGAEKVTGDLVDYANKQNGTNVVRLDKAFKDGGDKAGKSIGDSFKKVADDFGQMLSNFFGGKNAEPPASSAGLNAAFASKDQVERAKRVRAGLIARGWPAEAATGAAARSVIESGAEAHKLNPNDRGLPSYGLFQFRGDLLTRLEAYAGKSHDKGIDEKTQLDFINSLRHDPQYKNRFKGSFAAKDSNAAAAAFTEQFERPSRTNYHLDKMRNIIAQMDSQNTVAKSTAKPQAAAVQAPADKPAKVWNTGNKATDELLNANERLKAEQLGSLKQDEEKDKILDEYKRGALTQEQASSKIRALGMSADKTARSEDEMRKKMNQATQAIATFGNSLSNEEATAMFFGELQKQAGIKPNAGQNSRMNMETYGKVQTVDAVAKELGIPSEQLISGAVSKKDIEFITERLSRGWANRALEINRDLQNPNLSPRDRNRLETERALNQQGRDYLNLNKSAVTAYGSQGGQNITRGANQIQVNIGTVNAETPQKAEEVGRNIGGGINHSMQGVGQGNKMSVNNFANARAG